MPDWPLKPVAICGMVSKLRELVRISYQIGGVDTLQAGQCFHVAGLVLFQQQARLGWADIKRCNRATAVA